VVSQIANSGDSWMDKSAHRGECETARALLRLESEVREGLAHGFFELSITCEVIKGGKRRLIISAGKSYQFVIPEREVEMASR